MAYIEDLNQFLSQNPGDSYQEPQQAAQAGDQAPDPLAQGRADFGTRVPAPAYAGLQGDPFQTALIASAQLAITPQQLRRRRRPAAPPPQPFAGLSSFLGAR